MSAQKVIKNCRYPRDFSTAQFLPTINAPDKVGLP
jgi:hypothetical protein